MPVEDHEKLHEFLRQFYYNELLQLTKEEKPFLVVDFNLLDRFDPVLSEKLLEQPVSAFESFEKAVSLFDMGLKLPVRIKSIPEKRNIRLRNLRAEHIGKLLVTDVIVKSASEVKPQIKTAIFECPECMTRIEVEQEDAQLLQKPGMCSCGRRGEFPLAEKKMIDYRWLKGVEPFEVTSGEQPSELAILLLEDLTTPRMQKKTDPGNRLRIVGILKELPKRIKGKMTTKLDTFIDVNFFETTEIEFDDLTVTPEDEARILQLAHDPQVYQRLRNSIAPGIYGFDQIKEAVVLQLFGGIAHRQPDGTHIRGNIHLLLTGDPGVGKSLVGSSKILHNSDKGPEFTELGSMVDKIIEEGRVERINDSEVCFKNRHGIRVLAMDQKTQKLEWKPVSAFIRHESPKTLIKVRARSGREVIATKDHSFVALTSEGNIEPVKGAELNKKYFLPIPLRMHKQMLECVDTGPQKRMTNAKPLPPQIKLDWDFGFFLGMFIAEGSTQGGKTASISSMSKERREPIKKFAESIGLKYFEDNTSIVVPSRRLSEFLKRHCYSGAPVGKAKGSGAIKKAIPSFCFFAPQEFVKGLLSGLFSGDGYFLNAKPWKGRTKGNLKLELTTISKDLAYGLLEILSLIDIFAIIREKPYFYKQEKRTKYEITILGSNAQKLLTKIKMIGKPVPKIDRFSEKDALDSLPCTKLLYDAVRLLGYSRRLDKDSARHRAFAAMMRTVRSRGKIGRRRLERIAEMLASEAERQKNIEAKLLVSKLQKILQSNVVWDQIVSVEEVHSTEKYVYDLSVDGHETFVANNLVVHNSVMLKLASSVMPRGKYVSGTGATGAGMTASVRKDELLGSWVLEAGALILCNKGLIAIDEFDKINKDDQVAMHEAMSVETVSLAKASIVATLPAQTAVLAGANPKMGRFDTYRPIGEQIDIPETLLSRFDLKFALRDQPDKGQDEKLADHIIASRITPESITPEIDVDFLRKYIAYARKISSLELTSEAANALKKFYSDMRGKSAEGAVAITLRQFEALIRLAEASAKIRLDTKVRPEDAERSIRLVQFSLQQLGYDTETGTFDIDRAEGGMAAAQRSKRVKMLEVIDALQKPTGKEVSIEDVVAEAESVGISGAEAVRLVDKMKEEGLVFEPRPGFIRKL